MESLDKLETQGTQMRLSANAGSSSIVFPQEVWENPLANGWGDVHTIQPGDNLCRS